MPQDAFTIRLIAKELNEKLKGGKIQKINQPEREELSFLIYTKKRTVKLILSSNASDCGAYFSEEERENPLTAPNFCMLLRKHLLGAEILNVETPGFERILIFTLFCKSDFSSSRRELRLEIMGKYSNLILTENGIVLGALKTTSLDDSFKRAILPGVPYLPPAPQDKIDPKDKKRLSALFSAPIEGDLAKFLFLNVSGIAPSTAEAIAISYRGGSLSEHVYSYLFSDEISPCVRMQGGVAVDFSARGEGVPFPSVLDAESFYYSKKKARKRFEAFQRRLKAAAAAQKKKQEKRLFQILEKKRECALFEENRKKGEILYANLYRLERGKKSYTLPTFEGGSIEISLDPLLSPSENAQSYFKKYRKQKRAFKLLFAQEQEAREELDYAESLLAFIDASCREEDLLSLEEELLSAGYLKPTSQKRQKREEPSFRTFEKDGFTILAGRNNLQNDRLIKRSAPEDLWLHVKGYHSCHVVIQTEGKEVGNKVLLFAAEICAQYSDAKGGKVDVDYCRIKDVKKPPKSRAGSVIYSNFQTVSVESYSLSSSSSER